MNPTQRHLTALTALAVLVMVVAAGCASTKASNVALAGVDGSAGGTTVPGDDGASVEAPVPLADAGSSELPPADRNDIAAATVEADAAGSASTTARSVARNETGGAGGGGLDSVAEMLAEGDICGVYEGLSELPIDGLSTERFAAQLRRIRDIMIGAEDIAPAELHDDWVTVADATADVVAALEADPGSMNSAAKAYEDDDYLTAQQRVETWMESNCA